MVECCLTVLWWEQREFTLNGFNSRTVHDKSFAGQKASRVWYHWLVWYLYSKITKVKLTDRHGFGLYK